MQDKAGQRALHLSGGEKQRVAIARSLVNNPELILTDEPTGNLDDDAKHGILDIFSHLRRQGRTIVMVTHDAESARIADRSLRIHGGRLSAYESAPDPVAPQGPTVAVIVQCVGRRAGGALMSLVRSSSAALHSMWDYKGRTLLALLGSPSRKAAGSTRPT